MKMYHLFVWFIGAFVGSALSVWFGLHWLLGGILGALTGVGLTVWQEAWGFIKSVFRTLHYSKWTLIGCCRMKILEIKAQPLRLKRAVCECFETTPMFHFLAWFCVLLISTDSGEKGLSVPIFSCAALFCFSFPVLAGIGQYTRGARCIDEGSLVEKEILTRRYSRAKLSALKWNFFVFPFSLAYHIWRDIRGWWKKTDTRECWMKLLVSVHSHFAISSGIFCGIGAVAGHLLQSPFIGGFAGLAVGCVEYLLVRKFVPRVIYGIP